MQCPVPPGSTTNPPGSSRRGGSTQEEKVETPAEVEVEMPAEVAEVAVETGAGDAFWPKPPPEQKPASHPQKLHQPT
jgi:hypothetical protein